VVERGQHMGFAGETGKAVWVPPEGVGQDFNGDLAIQFRIGGAIDFPMPPRRSIQNAEPTDLGAGSFSPEALRWCLRVSRRTGLGRSASAVLREPTGIPPRGGDRGRWRRLAQERGTPAGRRSMAAGNSPRPGSSLLNSRRSVLPLDPIVHCGGEDERDGSGKEKLAGEQTARYRRAGWERHPAPRSETDSRKRNAY
jgi:hypothetical protein